MASRPIVDGSLKNDIVDGKVVGFSFGVRLTKYRGNMLSLINGFWVRVDGEVIEQDDMTFEINGKAPRTWAEIAQACWEHWDIQTVGYLHIKKEGGLTPGEHKIKASISNFEQYGYTINDEKYVNEVIVPTEVPIGFTPEPEEQTLVL